MYPFLLQDRKPDIILDTKMSSSPFDDISFHCFKCHITFHTKEIFSMHPCVEIKQEVQALNPRAVLASQGGSEQKTEISDQNAGKKVESKEDIPSPFDKVPDEIILKIFSFLSFKSLGNCIQVCHRIKRIAEDTSLWEKVEAWLRQIPRGFFEKMVKLKVKYISFQHCAVYPIDFNILKEHNLDLKYMDISIRLGNDEFISELLKCSKSLEYLNIQESRSDCVSDCIEDIAYPNNLKVFCISQVELDFESVKIIINRCTKLTDICINNADLTQQSIAYLCTNLTSNAIRVDLSYNRVIDENVQSLVERCPNLEHLDLSATIVTYKSFTWVVTALKHCLVSLALPQQVNIEIGLPSNVCMEKLNIIFELTHLQNLHIGCVRGYLYFFDAQEEVIYKDNSHIVILDKIFPNLNIGRGWESPEYRVLNTHPYYHFYKQKFKEVTCFPHNFLKCNPNLSQNQILKSLGTSVETLDPLHNNP